MKDTRGDCSCAKCRQAGARRPREDVGDARSPDDARCSCPQCRQADAYAEREDDEACDCRHGGSSGPSSDGSGARSDRDFGDADLDADDFDDELDDHGAQFGQDFGNAGDSATGDFDFGEDDELDDDDLDAEDAEMNTDDAEDLDFDDELDDDLDEEQELRDELDDDELDDAEESRYHEREVHGCGSPRCRRADTRHSDAARPGSGANDIEAEEAALNFESNDDADGADMHAFDFESSDSQDWHWMSDDDDDDGDGELIRTDASRDDLVDEFEDEDALEDLMDEWDAEDDLAVDDDDSESAGDFEEAWDIGHFPRVGAEDDDESLREVMGELDFVEMPWRKPDHDKSVRTWNTLPVSCRAIQRLEIWQGEQGNPHHLGESQYIARICDAVNLARDWLERTRIEIDSIYNRPTLQMLRAWNRHPSFPYWFGWGFRTKQQIWAVRRGIHRMRGWFVESVGARGLRFVVVKEETGTKRHLCIGTNSAYTLSPFVHLCPSFFDGTRPADTRWRAEVVIHELTHRLIQRPAAVTALGIFPGTQLGWNFNPGLWAALDHPGLTIRGGGFRRPTGQSDEDRRIARMLAHKRPLAARRSPSNWAILVREIGFDQFDPLEGRRHPV